jgi:mRNA interferase HigB
VELFGVGRLEDFKAIHSDARSQVDAWVEEVRDAGWRSMQDIKARYASASVISRQRVVFNIKGRRYRLDALVDFERQSVLVVRIGTHAEYDTWKW